MKYQEIEFRPNTLCHGDCLHILQRWVKQGRKVDLIYLDPPFNSKRNYNVIFRKNTDEDFDERAQFVAFQDTWNWSRQARERMNNLVRSLYGSERKLGKIMEGLELQLGETGMLAYISYMAERLIWMREILKETGSLYLHCDPTASHYLKVVLDGIFGTQNFRNEIVWQRSYVKGTRGQTKTLGSVTDIIFLYAASKKTNVTIPVSSPAKPPSFPHTDERGDYRAVTPLYGDATLHKCAKFKWRGHNPTYGWRVSFENLERLHQDDRIHYKPSGNPFRKQYKQEYEGVAVSNLWTDIPIARKNERLGYPTQKPRALLERIIKASSKKGDMVLDPFAGCGTAAAAAYQTGRKFIGIDILPYAITEVCQTRLKNARGVTIQGLPTDTSSAQHLGEADPFAFEQWAVSQLPGFMPNEKQVGDGGVDGRGILLGKPQDEDGEQLTRHCIAQVKLTKPSPDAIRALLSRINGGQAAIGVFITLKKLSMTRTMKEEIESAGVLNFEGGVEQYPRLLFWSIEEFFNGVFPHLPDRAHPITGKSMVQAELYGETTPMQDPLQVREPSPQASIEAI